MPTSGVAVGASRCAAGRRVLGRSPRSRVNAVGRRAALRVRADGVDEAVSAITSSVKSAGEAAKAAVGAAEQASGFAKKAADVVTPAAKTALDAAAPVVKDAASSLGKATEPVLKSLADKAPEAGAEVEKALAQQGINAKPVVEAGSQAVASIKPAASDFVAWFLAQDLATQGQTVLLAGAAVYFGPPALSGLAGALQGYAGDITAARALDLLATNGDALLIDIRRTAEKESSGIPAFPSATAKKALELEYESTEDKKLRAALASPDAVEAQITALKIAALKRTKRDAPLILLDKNCSNAKVVAKELAKGGFSQAFVVAGGFDGRNGWVQSKLATNQAKTVSSVSVVKPSAILPSVVPSISSATVSKPLPPSRTVKSKTVKSKTVKQLPPPKK